MTPRCPSLARALPVGVLMLAAVPARAQQTPPQQAPTMEELAREVRELAAQVAAQKAEIERLKANGNPDLSGLRGGGPGSSPGSDAGTQAAQATPAPAPTSSSPAGQTATPQVVGQNPTPKPDIQERAQAVPQGQGVLTPVGKTTVQLSSTYIRATNDRLVFAGIELVPGLQIGQIEASTAQRDTYINSLTVWHGFTDRLEAELTVPMMIRSDSIQLSQVQNGVVSEGFSLHKTAIGDVEGAIRWQLNAPVQSDQPIVVLGVRVKSDTGISPFSVPYDQYGVAKGLATGSGFWGVQPNVSFLLPSDPVVLYGGVSYLYQFPRTLDRQVNDILIGHVSPGGALGANVGFGFALNPRFSFSLGYSHTYIFPTQTELNGTYQRSSSLQVGTLDMGMSYRLNSRQSVNLAFQFGVTQDAPNVAISLRLPFTF